MKKISAANAFLCLIVFSANSFGAEQAFDPNSVLLKSLNENRNKSENLIEKDRREINEKFERRYRSSLDKNAASKGRGGLSDLTALGSDGGYAFKCRNGFGDVFMRDTWNGYCGGAIDGDYKCFRSASEAGNFVCR